MMSISHSLYAVYDRKAMYYLPPFAARGDAEAERTFTEACLTSETPLSTYPADFDLVLIGSIDLSSGVLSLPSSGMPMLMINGLSALQAAQASRARYKASLTSPDDAE